MTDEELAEIWAGPRCEVCGQPATRSFILSTPDREVLVHVNRDVQPPHDVVIAEPGSDPIRLSCVGNCR